MQALQAKTRHLSRFFHQLWKDDRGQSTTEYILILSVVVMIAMKFKEEFSSRLDSAISNVGGQIDSVTQESN